MEIYIENAKRNTYAREGWINLPIAEGELSKKLNLYCGETIITDYNLPFNITEYENPHIINEVLQNLLDINLTYIELKILFKMSDGDFQETAKKILNGEYQLLEINKNNEFKIIDETDVAYCLYENDLISFLGKLSDDLIDYIDWTQVWNTCNMSKNWNIFVDSKSLTTYAVNI